MSSSTPPSLVVTNRARRLWLAPMLAAGLALAVYAVTLGGSFVFDDTILHEDPRYTHRGLWGKFWTQDYWAGAVDRLYRPLTCMSFAVQYWVHGDRAWAYHAVNWLLHAGAAAAVAMLGRRLFNWRVGLAAGVLFAVHPVHVEAVAGLVGRAELLCTLAMVSGLWLYLAPMTVERALGIAVCLIVAILSKEQGLLMPALLAAITPWRREFMGSGPGALQAVWDVGSNDTRVARGVPKSAGVMRSTGTVRSAYPTESGGATPSAGTARGAQPTGIAAGMTRPLTSDNVVAERGAMSWLVACVCLITAGYIIVREELLGFGWDRRMLDWAANPLILAKGADVYLMPLALIGRYAVLLAAPVRLSIDYGARVIGYTIQGNEIYAGLGALVVLTWVVAMVMAWRRRTRAMLFCLAALAISYALVSNAIVLIGTIFGERLMYLPSVWAILLFAALLDRFLRAKTMIAIVCVLTLAGGFRSFTYARQWNDPLKLYETCLRAHPQSLHLHGLVAHAYIEAGRFRDARAIGQDSLDRLPDCWQSYQICVAADLKLHDYTDALRVLSHADRRCPPTYILKLRAAVEYEMAGSSGQK